MKVRKGEVVLSISPTDLYLYQKSGWRVVQEKTVEEIRIMNEKAKAKRLAKLKETEGKEDASES